MLKFYHLALFLLAFVSKGWSQTSSENYVLSRTYKSAGMAETSTSTTYSGTPASVQTDIVYIDGLGKTKQSVSTFASPSQKDILVHTVYDALQRPYRTFLPVFSSTGDGTFRSTPDLSYYASSANVTAPVTPSNTSPTYGYAETIYEASPLSRVKEIKQPGITANTTAKLSFKVYNSATDSPVKLYSLTINASNGLDYGFYPDGSLTFNETTDEDGKTIREYQDRYGRVVLKRVMIGTTLNDCLDTYYIYDQQGQVRYVLQPQFQNEANLTKFAFQYTYDNQGRMTSKRVPGTGGATNLYYDAQDRLIQSTDAKGQNFYYEYDALNRPNKTRFGSDDVSYTYYDNYSYTPFQSFNNEFSLSATDFVNNPQTDARKGLVTGTNTRLLNSNGTLGNWLQTVTYYDNKYRVIQTIRQLNGLGTGAYERVSYKYDFKGNVLTERTTQSANGATYILEKNYTYDHADRLLSVKHKLYEGSVSTTPKKDYTHLTNTYNEIGQLAQKSLHSGIQTLTYKYTPRGWLGSIGKTAGQTFSVDLSYKPNGNINTLSWGTASSSGSFSTITYDGANRLLSAEGTAYKENNITYDKNGNILTLQRIQNGTTIDNLVYHEAAAPYDGNRLMRVRDASGISGGFADNANIFNDYAYDNNGNLTQDLNKGIQANGIVYNPLNLTRQVTINSQTVSYIYDSNGNKRQMEAPGPLKTVYEGAFEYLNGTLQRIGLEEGQLIRNSNATYTVHYYLKDHLGNVRQVINEAGTVLQETEYYAFGMPVKKGDQTPTANKYLYNGKELQPSTNWLDYGARMYMPEIGRWGGIDPLAEKYFGVTGYNYVLNNPFLIIDPNGADTMLVHAETGKPIDKLMRKGGEDVIFISGENGTWENAFQLYYQLNITGKNGGTASKQNTPVHWRWKDSEGKYKYLSDQTIRFDAVTQNWVAYFEKENTRFNEFYGAGNQLMRLDFFREKVTDNAPLDIKALSNPTSFHPGVIGEWSWYNGQLMRYDDYGNISYGMVGAAFGLKNWLLLVGAHVNQIGKNIKGLFGSDGTSGVVDDSRDSRMINKGINLYYHQK